MLIWTICFRRSMGTSMPVAEGKTRARSARTRSRAFARNVPIMRTPPDRLRTPVTCDCAKSDDQCGDPLALIVYAAPDCLKTDRDRDDSMASATTETIWVVCRMLRHGGTTSCVR